MSNIWKTVGNGLKSAAQSMQYVAEDFVRFAVVQSSADEICFRILGCLSLKSPWVSLMRPLPRPNTPDVIDVSFYLYTRDHPERYYIKVGPNLDTSSSPFDPSKQTFFLTHGFLNSGNETWMANLKDALLSKVDGNVFIVDWGHGAMNPNYLQATFKSPVSAYQPPPPQMSANLFSGEPLFLNNLNNNNSAPKPIAKTSPNIATLSSICS